MMTVPLVDDRPRWVFKVKFQIQRVEGDGNVANAGVVGSNPDKPTRFPGGQKPSQFRSVSEAIRGLRTEFRPFSRILRLKSPASLCPQNSVSRTTRWRGRSRGLCRRARHGEALALPLADTEAQPLERQDVQLPAFIVSQCR